MSMLLDEAEENEDGDLIYELAREGSTGAVHQDEINVTHLFQPGIRKTSNLFILKHEAKRASDGEDIGNPAFPTSPEVADQLQDQLPDDVDPAYMQCRPEAYP